MARRMAEVRTWGPPEARAILAGSLVGTGSNPFVLAGTAGSLTAAARPLEDRQARAVLAASLVGKADLHPLMAVAYAELIDPAYEVYRTAPVRRQRHYVSHQRRSTIGFLTVWHSSARMSVPANGKMPGRINAPKINGPKISTPKIAKPAGRR
jgi:hypothetical protein